MKKMKIVVKMIEIKVNLTVDIYEDNTFEVFCLVLRMVIENEK